MTTEKAEPDTLLPCPFCGKQPASRWWGVSDFSDDGGYWDISCCGAFAHEDDEATAAKLWNTRAAPPRCDAQSEALRKARQYVADAGSDEDPETQANSSALLAEIDDLIPPPTKPAQGEAK